MLVQDIGNRVAEGGGFEPPEPGGSTVFKTVAFVRSAIPPGTKLPACGSAPRVEAGTVGDLGWLLLSTKMVGTDPWNFGRTDEPPDPKNLRCSRPASVVSVLT